MKIPVYPFDPERCIGTVTEVSNTQVKINLPRAAEPGSSWHHGHRLDAGQVGEFVVVEAGEFAVFGRISLVRLPERERLTVEQRLGEQQQAHPVGIVQLMATASLQSGAVEAGVPQHPRLASRCFAAHPELIKWLAEHTKQVRVDAQPRNLNLAALPFAADTNIRITPEGLFGRHCAVVGATGGGKSWTLARIIEESCGHNAKLLLLDATGEFHTQMNTHVKHVHFCDDPEAAARGSTEVALPYRRLTESDLLALFQPSPQVQAPRLRAAIKSLKLIHLQPALATDGFLVKANKTRKPIEDALLANAVQLEQPMAEFDITKLARQIQHECIWPSGRGTDAHKFGLDHDGDYGYCVPLIGRIEQAVTSTDLSPIFRTDNKSNLIDDVLVPFLADQAFRLLRVSLKEVSFAYGIREVLVNAIGRQLLRLARTRQFKSQPLVVVLDEAHQFIGKSLGEETNRYRLDCFELIAKEGRKYCLTLCLATQRPRDLGQGVISQMGSLLVHRLTNPEDRDFVEKAAGDLDRNAASFIPTLAAGQAVLLGIDFPIPVTLQMHPPQNKPDSSGPNFQKSWSQSLERVNKEATS